MYSIYWIRYNNHTDILSEGYVGVSTNTHERWMTHKRGNGNPIVCNAIKKGAVMEVIQTNLTKEEVCDKERILRPTENIGWNLAPGGGVPPSQKSTKKPGIPRTKEQKEHHSRVMKGRTSPHKGKKGHSKGCGTKECEFRGLTFKSRTEAAEFFDVTVSAVTMYNKRREQNKPIRTTSNRWIKNGN